MEGRNPVTVAFDEDFRHALEAKGLGQTHGLAAAIEKQFGGLHGGSKEMEYTKYMPNAVKLSRSRLPPPMGEGWGGGDINRRVA
jgi:hypothetical protein